MPDGDYRVQPITFERGVNESVEPSLLPAGAAVRIRNWIPEPSGGLRSRVGWSKASTTGAPTTRKARGIGTYIKTTRPVKLQGITNEITSSNATVTVSVPWTRDTQAGTFLVMRVLAGQTHNTTAISGVTVSSGWSTAVTKNSASGTPGQFIGIYYVQNNGGAQSSPSVSITGAGSVDKRLFVEISEWANMDTTAVFATASSTTSTNGGESVTVTWADPAVELDSDNPDSRLDIAAAFVSAVGNFTSGTSVNDYREEYDSNTGGVGTVGLFYRLATDKRLAFNQDISTSGHWITAAVCFKGAPIASETAYIAAAHAHSGVIYKLYSIERDNLASGTWSNFDTLELTSTNATTTPPVAFATGLGGMFYCSQHMPSIRMWNAVSNGGAAMAIANSPSGRTLAFHNNRLWSAGSIFAPTRLFYSEINDPYDWTGIAGVNYIDISTDDGEPIEDIISFGSTLLIGKKNSLWLLSGVSEEDFVLSKLAAGGAAPGRSMVATPYGAVVAGRTTVWLVGDGQAQSVSRAIPKSYAFGGTYMSTSFANDVVSICDEATGYIWSLNMSTGIWSEERVDSATECPALVTQWNDLQMFCPKEATVGSLVSYRSLPSATRSKDFDTLSETFEALTPEIWPVGNTVKITPRHLYVRVRQRGGSADQTGLTITPYYEGWEGTAQTFGPEDEAGSYRYRFDLGEKRGINYAQFKFSQTLPTTHQSLVDIEEVEFGFNVEQVR